MCYTPLKLASEPAVPARARGEARPAADFAWNWRKHMGNGGWGSDIPSINAMPRPAPDVLERTNQAPTTSDGGPPDRPPRRLSTPLAILLAIVIAVLLAALLWVTGLWPH
jgi:hypothetical protein